MTTTTNGYVRPIGMSVQSQSRVRKCYQREEYGGEVLQFNCTYRVGDLCTYKLARTCNSGVTYLGWDVPGVEADGVIAIIVPLVPF